MLKIIVVIMLFPFILSANEKVLIKDKGVEMSENEIMWIVKGWPKGLREEAANDKDAMHDYLGQMLAKVKMSKDFDNQKNESIDQETFWKNKITVDAFKAKLFQQRYMDKLKIPDMTALAKEKYNVRKELFAKVDEKRASSHILFACDNDKACKLAEEKAKKVLGELKDGASFEEFVKEYSEDPGSKDKKGSLGQSISKKNKNIVVPYISGLFEISKEGKYSKIVKTRFGYHIVRLDKIEKEHIRPFDEAKDEIVTMLNAKYKELAQKALSRKYLPSESVKYNDDALSKIFEEYKDK